MDGGAPATEHAQQEDEKTMATLILFCLLALFSWPLALAALLLYPLIWLLCLPFRLLGIAVDSVFALLRAILMLPARLLGFKS